MKKFLIVGLLLICGICFALEMKLNPPLKLSNGYFIGSKFQQTNKHRIVPQLPPNFTPFDSKTRENYFAWCDQYLDGTPITILSTSTISVLPGKNPGSNEWLPNNKILFADRVSDTPLKIYNPDTASYTQSTVAASWSRGRTVSTILRNGNPIFFPTTYSQFGGVNIYSYVYNYLTDSITTLTYLYPTVGLSHLSCVNLTNGDVLLIPSASTTFLLYDESIGDIRAAGNTASTTDSFGGGCLGIDGRVYLSPYTSDYIGIYDPVTETYARGPAIPNTSEEFYGPPIPYKNFIYFFESTAPGNTILKYDIDNNSLSTITVSGFQSSRHFGVLCPGGDVLLSRDSTGIFDVFNVKTNAYRAGINTFTRPSESAHDIIYARDHIFITPRQSSATGTKVILSNMFTEETGKNLFQFPRP